MKQELTNIFDLKPASRVLVEASAGTGKTYTIVGIFIRLLIEKELSVEQILTVTFTKKATAELRERILSRLRECLTVVETGGNPEGSDEFLDEFERRYSGDLSVSGKLREAIRNFDDSQVFTIHGFCQKILQEEALSAGTPFEMAVNPSGNLYERAAEDYWRIFMDRHGADDAGRYLISKLMSIASTPAELAGKNGISTLLEKQYARLEGETLDDPKAYLQELLELKSRIKQIYDAEGDDIYLKLKGCDIKRYSAYLDSRWQSIIDYVNDEQYQLDKPEKLQYFTKDYLYDESRLKKNGNPVERHEFFELCSELERIVDGINRVETTLVRWAYDDIRIRREKLSKSNDTYSYNDLLISVRDALIDSERGNHLAEKLNRRYPVALVDEFQDTDPIQYDIFKTVYPAGKKDSSLMMIGDPKQAIYAFRGADLHTYFKARNDGVDQEYTLKRNYRSTVQYIKAVNHLFDGDQQPFIEDNIEFEPSAAGRNDHTDSLLISGKVQAPLQVVSRRGVETNKGSACDFAFNETVSRIAKLLQQTDSEYAKIGVKRLKAGDIAILISRNKDAYDLQQRLKQAGIDSVTKTDQNIFETLEARKMEMLINAVLNPTVHRVFNSGLLTGMFGFDLASLRDISADEDKRQQLTGELADLAETWRREGFYSMFYHLIYKDRRLVNFSRLNRSERIITNLFHLADLCANAEKEHLLSPEKLHTWLLRQMEQSDEEEKELQLESDRNLVKIMTIHSSKGLQFPIVFCPTLWMGYEPNSFAGSAKKMVEYHTGESEDLIINFDRERNDRRIEAEFASDLESVAEDVRKTYVALTRAKYSTVVIWDSHSNSNVSGLGASLIGRQLVIDSINNKLKVKEDDEITDSDFISRFENLQEISENLINLELVSPDREGDDETVSLFSEQPELSFRAYSGRDRLEVQKKLESFTSLAGHGSEPGVPDYDQLLDNFSAPFDDGFENKKEDELNIFDFPKGATAGTAIHKLFEHASFEFNGAEKDNHSGAIKEILEEYDFDLKWAPVIQQMIRDLAGCNMPGFDLGGLAIKDERREMEFHFPAGSADGVSLLGVIRNEPVLPQEADAGQRYMTGFIDLVARQNGQYIIIDYKSNYLGDTPEDYSQGKLKEEIMSASYDLQYHLYTVALVKFLRSKISDFDYDTHFMGVAYLFVRGMKAGSDKGVWFYKPDKEVITKLERMLSRES